jgi:hypothetical protein
MSKFDSGILLIAYNNGKIDYEKLALVTARCVKLHMNNNHVTLLTDQPTFDALKLELTPSLAAKTFDHIIIDNVTHERNTRTHRDSPWNEFTTQFNNKNKHSIFNKSPYNKTLMIDVDYLIGNDTLDAIFDTDSEVAMYKQALSVRNYKPRIWEQKLHPDGIDMWWSTAVYWRNDSELAKLFFGVWEHVKENYNYYKWLYKFPGVLFRTDYAVSIAVHILNGHRQGNLIHELPGKVMRFSEQIDDIAEFKEINDMILVCPDPKELWKSIASRVKNENVHVMNKMAILRHYPKIKQMIYD